MKNLSQIKSEHPELTEKIDKICMKLALLPNDQSNAISLAVGELAEHLMHEWEDEDDDADDMEHLKEKHHEKFAESKWMSKWEKIEEITHCEIEDMSDLKEAIEKVSVYGSPKEFGEVMVLAMESVSLKCHKK